MLIFPLGVLVIPDLIARELTAAWVTAVLLVVVFLVGFTTVQVTVVARGVTVRYGVVRVPLTRIPRRAIASAEAVEEHPLGFFFPVPGNLLVFGEASVALRSGPALKLALRNGKTFLVTVDDATTGAALLNDLIAASANHAGEPPRG